MYFYRNGYYPNSRANRIYGVQNNVPTNRGNQNNQTEQNNQNNSQQNNNQQNNGLPYDDYRDMYMPFDDERPIQMPDDPYSYFQPQFGVNGPMEGPMNGVMPGPGNRPTNGRMNGPGTPMTEPGMPMTGPGTPMTGPGTPMTGPGTPMTGPGAPMNGRNGRMNGPVNRMPEMPTENPMDILREAILMEPQDQMYFDAMISMTNDPEDKEILQGIMDNHRRHNQHFRNIFRNLTGREVQNGMTPTFKKPTSYEEGLKNGFFKELDTMEHYRILHNVMPNQEFITILSDIIADHMENAMKYQYLLTKEMTR